MSKHETPMTHRHWEQVGGTLLEEYLIVPRGPGIGQRLIEGRFAPKTVRTVALCVVDDAVLRPLAESLGIEVG